jgi:hypothetical protein
VLAISVHVLVPAPGEIDDDEIARLELREALDQTRQGVRGFKRRDDAFGTREKTRGFERGGIGDGGVFGAPLIGEPGVFGPDGGIVEAGRYGMRCGDLAVFVLQDVGVGTLENTRTRTSETLMGREASSVFAERLAAFLRRNP